MRLEPSKLATILSDSVNLCRNLFNRNGVELRTEVFDPKIMVECNPIELTQVIFSLINNAFYSLRPIDEKWVQVVVKEHDRSVDISISNGRSSDNSEEHSVNTIGEAVNQKTGLETSLCRRILERHKGTLLSGVPGRNDHFVIKIPKQLQRALSDNSAA